MSDTMIYSCAYDDCEMRPKLTNFKHFYFTWTVMLSNHYIYTIIQYQTNYNWIGVQISTLLMGHWCPFCRTHWFDEGANEGGRWRARCCECQGPRVPELPDSLDGLAPEHRCKDGTQAGGPVTIRFAVLCYKVCCVLNKLLFWTNSYTSGLLQLFGHAHLWSHYKRPS